MPCKTGKISYSSLSFAEEDLARINAQSGNPITPIRAYFCEFCGKWHTTSHGDRSNETNLLKRNAELARELKAVKAELEILKRAEDKELRKEFKLKAKTDAAILCYKGELEANKKTIETLRDANYSLIARLNKQQPI